MFALVAAGLLAPIAHAADPAEATVQLDRLLAASLPRRDPVDLAQRFRGLPPGASAPPPLRTQPLPVGQDEAFFIVDQRAGQTFEVRARLQYVSESAYWYVQNGWEGGATRVEIERSARVFESQTYPAIRRFFGAAPSPGVDGDPRIVFLLGDVPGVAAYFSGVDAYPRAVNPRSNQREIIYVNLGALRPGSAAFDATMAHEFQHMVQFARCPAQETWIDEGSAELAVRLAGFGGTAPFEFMARPDVQLTTWTSTQAEFGRHYQAGYLFMRYASTRLGGPGVLPELIAGCGRGTALFDRDAASGGWSFDRLFQDWVVANLLDDSTVADGRYGYPEDDVWARITATLAASSSLQGSVPQYAANYVDLPSDVGSVRFRGSAEVSLLPGMAGGGPGGLWWSNRADSLDSRLTRRIDLRGVSSATARFSAWYAVESGYDFVYLSASRDGGLTWETLPGRYTTNDDAMGNSFGVGWTGVSGGGTAPTWIEEEVDLSSLAGTEVLLRFEYVTDQGYNAAGFAFRSFEVAPAPPREDDTGGSAWASEGWVLVNGPVPQPWSLQRVTWSGGSVTVEPVPVDAAGSAEVPLDPAAERTVLVIAAMAPRTLEQASYELTPSRNPGS